jgi:hypothetical protein
VLGAVAGRTFTGDTSQTVTLERSTLLVDHTFVKAQRDNGSPAASYTILGNNACEGGIVPLSAVSRKTHDSISPPFDIPLPLSGNLGIECRSGGSGGNFQIVVTFAGPVTFTSAGVSSGTGSVASSLASGNQIFVNLSGVVNAQRISLTLNGVNDGTNIADVAIPMGVLLADVDATGRVDGNDVSAVQSHTRQTVGNTNFRFDVDLTGRIDGNDVSTTQAHTRTSLP